MAKHDQRILKFLNQNADRAPTITEMMTRMNISIADISESLANLQSHGVVSKKTNNQGIEYWFPTSPVAVPPPMPQVQAHSPHFTPHQVPIQPLMAAAEPQTTAPPQPQFQQPKPYVQPQSNPQQKSYSQPLSNPQPQAIPQAQPRPIQRGEPVYSSSNVRGENPPQMAQPTGSLPIYGYSQPSSKGVGLVPFLVGLAATAGLSYWLAGQQVETKMKKAATSFVDRKSLAETNLAFSAFQAQTKTHVTALEAEVEKLSGELAFSKAAAESLKTVVAAKPDKVPVVATPKGKAIKKLAQVAKTKSKAKAASSSASAMEKAAARGAAQRRKAAASAEPATNENSDYNSSYEPSNPEPSRGLPDRPGLEELPPPPTE